MQYGIYKLKFPYGVHFGNRVLEDTKYTFAADTLFSALCIEAIRIGQNCLEQLLQMVKSGDLTISDAFPYVGDEYFLPKPYLRVEKTDQDASKKKKYKKMKYIKVSDLKRFSEGDVDVEAQLALEQEIGKKYVKTSAAIRGLEDTLPYRVGIFEFSDNAGLYILYGYETDEAKDLFDELLIALSFSGLGGKRSSGLGRYEVYNGSVDSQLRDALEKESSHYMALSIALPKDEELDQLMEGATYMLTKRSGFVESTNYSESYMRKQDLFMFESGSVFAHKFSGDVFDVSSGGTHPVYRYGKPLFIGV